MATLKITQVRSTNERSKRQRRTLRALGLRRIRHTVEHQDTPQIRGMVRTVHHLVEVEELEDAAPDNGIEADDETPADVEEAAAVSDPSDDVDADTDDVDADDAAGADDVDADDAAGADDVDTDEDTDDSDAEVVA